MRRYYRTEPPCCLLVWWETDQLESVACRLRWRPTGMPNDPALSLHVEIGGIDLPDRRVFTELFDRLGAMFVTDEPPYEAVVELLESLGYERDQDHVPL